MKIKNVAGVTVITADNGKHFVNTEDVKFGFELWLGKEDAPSNYKEVEDNLEVTNGWPN